MPIESASAEQITALSTSEISAILDEAQRRIRIEPLVLIVCIILLIVALLSKNQFLLGLVAITAFAFVPLVKLLDRYRRSVRIDYTLDDTAKKISIALDESFADLKECSLIWNVTARGDISDRKRNAGATELAIRQRIQAQTKRPSCIRGDVSFPCLKIYNEELYFLPDAMLVIRPKSAAALRYKDFTIAETKIHYIETGKLPADTTVVGRTWRFVTQKGAPDRRFSNNQELPICLYGEMALSSPGGLNVILHLSNPSASDRFIKVGEVLRNFDASATRSKPVRSFSNPKRWPTTIFMVVFLASSFAGMRLQYCRAASGTMDVCAG
jgi:hypothetical protein